MSYDTRPPEYPTQAPEVTLDLKNFGHGITIIFPVAYGMFQLSDSMSWSHLSKDYNPCGVKAIQICVRDMIKWYIFRNWELSKKNILWCLQNFSDSSIALVVEI